MKVHIGTAPDSWGVWFPNDPHQTPWNRFLDEVAEAGHEWIELGPMGYLPTDVPTLKAELNHRGLKVSGTFVMRHFEELTAEEAAHELDISTAAAAKRYQRALQKLREAFGRASRRTTGLP